MTDRRAASPVAFTDVSFGAAGVQAQAVSAIHRNSTIGLLPIIMGAPETERDAPLVQREIAHQLQRLGYRVVRLDDARQSGLPWAAFNLTSYLALATPERAEMRETVSTAVVDAIAAFLQHAGEAAILLTPAIVVRRAWVQGRLATWDGVSRDRFVAARHGYSPGTDNSAAGFSLVLTAYSADGNTQLFQHYGGLTLLPKSHGSERHSPTTPPPPGIRDEIAEGVGLVLANFDFD
jgi:hypothetical protein